MSLHKSAKILSNNPRSDKQIGSNNFAEYKDKQDHEIWLEFREGSVDVLIYMYDRYVEQLLRFGLQFAPRDVVKDSIQDLFLYLKERNKHTDKVTNISAYLYKALYRIINKKVQYFMKSSTFDPNLEVKYWRVVLSREIKLIEQENQLEQHDRLQQSLNDLSAKQRQAILLYYYEGFTHQEIADIMELKNKSSVRKLMCRGLQTLQEHFSR